MSERYITAREILLVIQESQPKLDHMYLNKLDYRAVKFIANGGFILIPNRTVDIITNHEWLKKIFRPIKSEILLAVGCLGTFYIAGATRQMDIHLPIYIPGATNIDFECSHDFAVFLTPQRFDAKYSADHQFAPIIGK